MNRERRVERNPTSRIKLLPRREERRKFCSISATRRRGIAAKSIYVLLLQMRRSRAALRDPVLLGWINRKYRRAVYSASESGVRGAYKNAVTQRENVDNGGSLASRRSRRTRKRRIPFCARFLVGEERFSRRFSAGRIARNVCAIISTWERPSRHGCYAQDPRKRKVLFVYNVFFVHFAIDFIYF